MNTINKFVFDCFSLTIDFAQKRVSSLLFKGEEMVEGDVPFFKIRLRDKNGTFHYVPANVFSLRKIEGRTAYYSHPDLDVALTIKEKNLGLAWSIKVINHTDLLIEQVELMSLGLDKDLREDGGRGEILIPYNEGVKISSMQRRESCVFKYYDVDYPSKGVYFMYPNMISSPFMAYVHKGSGIYLAMLDKACTPKHIDFCVKDGALQTILSVFTNVGYGQDYEMDFESVMLFFEGDFHDACNLYRDWFYLNKPDDLKTIKDKYSDLPSWYHKSPVVITYPIVGKKDSDLEMKPGGLYPYTNGLPVIDYYSRKSDSIMMTLLMQWESTAPWAPPYSWPPYGDLNDFENFNQQLHKNGHCLGLYCSGFGWTNKSYRKKYDRTKEFEDKSLSDIMCANSDGSLKSNTVSDIRLGYDVCPSCETSKEIFVKEAQKIIDQGIDYIQILDQNHGGNPYFCYSDKHGHVPAPGSWQIKETKELLNRIQKKDCLLGCETAASEPYLSELLFSDNRYILNYYIGEPIPMYSYIYHEFVNNFMGNQICYAFKESKYSLTYRMAYSFISGDLYTLVIDGEGKLHAAWCDDTIVDDEMPLRLIRNTNHWRIGRFADYLHCGKMVKPVAYKCGKKKILFRDYDYTFSFDAVLSAAYSNGEDVYQFFINYDEIEECVELNQPGFIVFHSPDDKGNKAETNTITVPPLSMVAIKVSE